MAGSTSSSVPRRLPVFFLLDASRNMGGTFQVTMQNGLQTLKDELSRQTLSSPLVYLSAITFGEQVTWDRPKTPKDFEPSTWQAQGECMLGPAFVQFTALISRLMKARPDHPGDHTPLVFLVLGDRPADHWQDKLAGLAAINDNRRPRIITLVTRPELVPEMKVISSSVFLLKPAKAIYMTKFFFWVTQSIIKVAEDCSRGATTITLPNPPPEVVGPY